MDIVCLTEKMYTGQELMFIVNTDRLSEIHGQNIKLVFVHLNQTSHGIRTANQEEQQCSPWTMYYLGYYKKDKILQVWDVGIS